MKVLALDGGGIRGLIPALVLAEIERRTGRRIGDLVDLIAGTSTGAIMACALARPDPMPAVRIAEIYEQEGPQIFDRSLLKRIVSADGLLDERYDSAGLVAALERHLGGVRLPEARPPLLLTAYDIERRRAVFLRSADDDVTMGESTRPLRYEDVRGWGRLEWVRPLIDVVFDGSADAVDLQLSALLGSAYVRLQTPLDEASDDFDDASAGNLAALRREADRLIAARDDEIDRVCERLTAP